jgi:hypothetical protein
MILAGLNMTLIDVSNNCLFDKEDW